MKKKIILHCLIILIFFCSQPILKAQETEKKIPEIKGYIGLVHPLYTFSNDGNSQNFKTNYIVGNPWGINIWKSEKVGLSFEFTPFIKSDKQGSKVSNLLFQIILNDTL